MKEHLGPILFFLVVLFQAMRARFAMESFRAILKPEHEEIRWGTETVSALGRSTYNTWLEKVFPLRSWLERKASEEVIKGFILLAGVWFSSATREDGMFGIISGG